MDKLTHITKVIIFSKQSFGELTPKEIRDVWDELYATGNIEIITNLDLKNDLLMLYRNLEQYHKVEEMEWNIYNLGIRRLVGEVLPTAVRLDIMTHLTPLEYDGGIEKQIPPLDIMLARLKSVKGLNGYLIDIIMARWVSQQLLNNVIEEMREIIDKLEDGLN